MIQISRIRFFVILLTLLALLGQSNNALSQRQPFLFPSTSACEMYGGLTLALFEPLTDEILSRNYEILPNLVNFRLLFPSFETIILIGRFTPAEAEAGRSDLGLLRAQRVASELVARGFDPGRLLSRGEIAHLPRQLNRPATSGDWPLDRRVEIDPVLPNMRCVFHVVGDHARWINQNCRTATDDSIRQECSAVLDSMLRILGLP